jgi:hypothetical protein
MTKVNMDKVVKEFERQKNDPSEANAKKRLQSAGILDKKGNVTEPYKGVFVKCN